MSRNCLYNISKFIQFSQPFFDTHHKIASDYNRYNKNVTFKIENTKQQLATDNLDASESSEKQEKDLISITDPSDSEYLERIETASKYKVPNLKKFKILFVSMIIISLICCVFSYILITQTILMSLSSRGKIQDFFQFYSDFILSWSISVQFLYTDKLPYSNDYYRNVINTTNQNLLKYSFISENSTLYNLLSEGNELILQATYSNNFTDCYNTTIDLVANLNDYGKSIYALYAKQRNSVQLTLYLCIAITFACTIICLILFFVAYHIGSELFTLIAAQPMHLTKIFTSETMHKYHELGNVEKRLDFGKDSLRSTFILTFSAIILPFIVSFAYSIDMDRIHRKYLRTMSCTLFASQQTGVLVENTILLPLLRDYGANTNYFQSFEKSYSIIFSILKKFMNLNITINITDDSNIIISQDISDEDVSDVLKNVNQTKYVLYTNGSVILLRDMSIINLDSEETVNLSDVSIMAIPSNIYCGYPMRMLLNDFLVIENSIYDSLLFSFILTLIILAVILSFMAIFVIRLIKRYYTALDLVIRIISIPNSENPFFDDTDGTFTGFKEPPYPIMGEIFDSLPIPTFQLNKKYLIIDQNTTSEMVFGDIRGSNYDDLPNHIVDPLGNQRYYNYNLICKRVLPRTMKLAGQAIVLSNDMSGLAAKKEILKNLNKDIRLTFSIPNILQREKPTTIQDIAIVNFGFSKSVSNQDFLNFSSKIEDMFSQFVSFFMFEKMRFSFYVLFHDSSLSRQPMRDAVSFAQIARDAAKLQNIDVKIAVSMEHEVIAKAQRQDMIWSVTFLNSILWRTDAMLNYIDYGKIICLSKMMSGMHFTKNLHIGKFAESTEVIII
ncbi:hypothetical protein TVAG_159530 [Trichomonas vaginalis G3]|uniref:Uncharacterized protein n=1 Tax=Trichomonas vaginalis (strain ATCC PRA-98 / G3) TaxID=412133 RepID=A2F5A8_TRIV3|nr:hypothetical protein TVAGG3_0159910 [Trichomonas vaginalis G3]EAX99933.1 hypothetical protein TVAG_159530 [Trichomonas vaginalis G3]KAI5547786.1 hypothetical protein TVAGG3_0159910 [Trichomonas vaginalis G3]|eukprot:XP_001312863.1 hypothetical protein [Trichomonas vaginalis G3]